MRVVPIIYPKENKHTGAQTLHPLFKQFNKGRRGQTVIRREECDPWASPVDCEERYGGRKKKGKKMDGRTLCALLCRIERVETWAPDIRIIEPPTQSTQLQKAPGRTKKKEAAEEEGRWEKGASLSVGVSPLWAAREVQSRVRASGVFRHRVTNQLWRPSPINPYPPQTSLDVATIGVPPPLFGPSVGRDGEETAVRGKAAHTRFPPPQQTAAHQHTHTHQTRKKEKNQMIAARHLLVKLQQRTGLSTHYIGKKQHQQQSSSESIHFF